MDHLFIREEVARLTEDGVDIIIALGHSGYEKGRQ
jgi:2',3'-cyclic-nucleotide 2'-phosphodiesterase (5'-nucleotidase family)